ncbi:MAG TPA: hypothetical protein VF593_00045 [Chthoniobacteraceae bacterium]
MPALWLPLRLGPDALQLLPSSPCAEPLHPLPELRQLDFPQALRLDLLEFRGSPELPQDAHGEGVRLA